MITTNSIEEIAKPFIRVCGGYGAFEDAIPDRDIEDFARCIEKAVITNMSNQSNTSDHDLLRTSESLEDILSELGSNLVGWKLSATINRITCAVVKELSSADRLEVIDGTGRAYTVRDAGLRFSMQDEDCGVSKTLKIFVTEKE